MLLSCACSLWKVAVVGGEVRRLSVPLITLTRVEERLKDARRGGLVLIAGVQCLQVHLSLRAGPFLRLVQVEGLPAGSRCRQRRAESLLRFHTVEMLVEV